MRGWLDLCCAVQVRTNLKGSALYLACQRGHPEIVRLLLDAGADVRAGAGWGLVIGGWPWVRSERVFMSSLICGCHSPASLV